MGCITVHYRACRELIIVLLTVQALLDTAVVALALLVAFTILKKDSFLIFSPIVAVVCVKMTLVKSEFRQEHRIACELIEVSEQHLGLLIYHHESVEIRAFMHEAHGSRISSGKVVFALLESMEHHAVATCRPIERRR